MKSPSIPLLQRGKTPATDSVRSTRPAPPFEKGGLGGIRWCAAPLSEICRINPPIDKAAIPDDLHVSFVPMSAVEAETGKIDLSATREFGTVKKGYTPFREGDVLFAKITPCMENGKMAVVPPLINGLGFGSTEFHVLRASEGISPQYLYYYVSSRGFRHQAEHNMSGAVGQRRVPTPFLGACKLPLPPTNEQHRIVAKIEELFSELDKGVESLKTAQAQLKVYRQALLKSAFEGKLTAEWRAENPDKVGTAEALFERIQQEGTERHRLRLTAWEAGGREGAKPKSPQPVSPLTAEDLADLPELPATWRWTRVGELVDRVTVGYVGPMKSEYIEAGVPFLRSQNVRENRFDACGLKFVSHSFHHALQKSALTAGDVVVVRSGSVGVSCVIPEHLGEANCSDLVIAKNPRHVSPHLLAYYLNWQTQGRVKGNIVGVALSHFNTRSVEGFAYPLCSAQEQEQLVRLLSEKLSEVDQLGQTISDVLQQTDVLRQSILKKAFSGQLVPQDPDDEPASKLLERIRAERAKAGKVKSRRSR